MATDVLLSTAQVGKALHLNLEDVRSLIRDGVLPAVHRPVARHGKKAGRPKMPRMFVKQSDLEAYIAGLEPVALKSDAPVPLKPVKASPASRTASRKQSRLHGVYEFV